MLICIHMYMCELRAVFSSTNINTKLKRSRSIRIYIYASVSCVWLCLYIQCNNTLCCYYW